MTQRSWPQKAITTDRSAALAIPLAPATAVAKAPILFRAVRRPISSPATRFAATKAKEPRLPDDWAACTFRCLCPGAEERSPDAAPNWHDARDTQPSLSLCVTSRISISIFSRRDMMTSFGRQVADSVYGQWICHSPNVMKTDIFNETGRGESSKSQGVSDLIRSEISVRESL